MICKYCQKVGDHYCFVAHRYLLLSDGEHFIWPGPPLCGGQTEWDELRFGARHALAEQQEYVTTKEVDIEPLPEHIEPAGAEEIDPAVIAAINATGIQGG